MPVTLAEAKLRTTDDVDLQVIDEFAKNNDILNRLTFDDAVNPAGGGATLTYTYTRLMTQRGAAFRAINTEYTPVEVTSQRYSTDLHPLGGSFQIDRVLAGLGPTTANEVTLQMSQLIKGSNAFFCDQVVNGDSAVDANGFDGLDRALAGSVTEYQPTTITDWTSIDSKAEAVQAITDIDSWLSLLDEPPDVIYGNRVALARFKTIAMWADQYDQTTDNFGRPVNTYDGIPLIDLKSKAGSNTPVIPIESRDLDNSTYTVTITGGPTGGTFTLTANVNGAGGQTTATIAYNASASAVQSALAALSNVGAGSGNVTVTGSTGGPYTVTFAGNLTSVPVTLTASGTGLTGGTSPGVTVAATGNAAQSGLTDLYAVRFGLDGFHGVSMANRPLVRTWLPDFSVAGAVKTGEAEMGPVGVVLKRTKAAGVFRNLKVQ